MTWVCSFSKLSSHQLKRIPRDRQVQIAQAIDSMQTDPLLGDVRPIKSGTFKGALRARVGRYRIIFFLTPETKTIMVAAIVIRDEKTYR